MSATQPLGVGEIVWLIHKKQNIQKYNKIYIKILHT